jgi:hypothetical protein
VADVIADGGADVAVSNNVLNVIEEPENIKRVIEQAENAIKPGDKAYFTVYAGNRSGKGAQTTKGYQRNEPTSAYVSRVEEVFGEGNVQSKGDLITATKPSNVASMGAKQKFNIEDDYTVYAMSEIDRYMLNKVDDIPWSSRSTFIAEREAYKRYLTRADLQEAMNIRNADKLEDDVMFISKGHLQKIIEEKSGKKIPELLDEIKDELDLPKNQIEWAESDNDFIAQWGSINDLEDTRSAIEKARSKWGGADVKARGGLMSRK